MCKRAKGLSSFSTGPTQPENIKKINEVYEGKSSKKEG